MRAHLAVPPPQAVAREAARFPASSLLRPRLEVRRKEEREFFFSIFASFPFFFLLLLSLSLFSTFFSCLHTDHLPRPLRLQRALLPLLGNARPGAGRARRRPREGDSAARRRDGRGEECFFFSLLLFSPCSLFCWSLEAGKQNLTLFSLYLPFKKKKDGGMLLQRPQAQGRRVGPGPRDRAVRASVIVFLERPRRPRRRRENSSASLFLFPFLPARKDRGLRRQARPRHLPDQRQAAPSGPPGQRPDELAREGLGAEEAAAPPGRGDDDGDGGGGGGDEKRAGRRASETFFFDFFFSLPRRGPARVSRARGHGLPRLRARDAIVVLLLFFLLSDDASADGPEGDGRRRLQRRRGCPLRRVRGQVRRGARGAVAGVVEQGGVPRVEGPGAEGRGAVLAREGEPAPNLRKGEKFFVLFCFHFPPFFANY